MAIPHFGQLLYNYLNNSFQIYCKNDRETNMEFKKQKRIQLLGCVTALSLITNQIRTLERTFCKA